MAGGLDAPAGAALRSADGLQAAEDVRDLGAPDDDLAAIAPRGGARVDGGCRRDIGGGRVRRRSRALEVAADQYLAIVLPGRIYKSEYEKRGLAPENLSRALEDAGTITSPLIPWNTCGA